MNWSERHLNWTLVLGVWGAGFAIYILNLILGLLLGDFGGVIGFIIGLVLVAYVAGWHVQRKGRNLWNALWIFAPFGIVLLLCLKNLTCKETEPEVSAEKERHEILTTESREKEYEHNVWEIYRREWETASPEKLIELNERMRRWQELMKNGLSASQAYIRVMQEEPDKSPLDKAIEEESDYRVVEKPSGKRPAIPSAFWMRKAPLVFLGLALVAAIVYCVVITGDRNALNTELKSVQSTLTSTQAQLSSTQGQLNSANVSLASSQAELGSTKQTLASTQSELSSTKQTLTSTQAELSSTQQTLASAQQASANLQATLSRTQQQLKRR